MNPRTQAWIGRGWMTRDGLDLTEAGEAEAERLYHGDDDSGEDYPSPHGWAPDLPEDRYAA